MSYGYCPICGAKGKSRERRINGDDRCENDHVYPSSTTLKTPPENDSQISMEQKILQLQEELTRLQKENISLKEFKEDWEDDYRKTVSNSCAPDEKHCSCVPFLRLEIKSLKTRGQR